MSKSVEWLHSRTPETGISAGNQVDLELVQVDGTASLEAEGGGECTGSMAGPAVVSGARK
jgi:hypothetical protein